MNKLRRLVFTSANIDVFSVECTASNTVIVTFDAFSDACNQERKGFGEAYFEKIGITAYHFIHRHNLWYSFPEMAEALALVKSRIPAGQSIVTYGASMGGYAAYRSSGLLNADKIIAFSPQYSVDANLVPWEKRWQGAIQNCTHLMDSLPINTRSEIYLFYDPETSDARHAELISQHGRSIHIPIPYSGHYSIAMMQQLGILDSTIRKIIAGDFDAATVQREIFEKSDKSAHFLINKAKALPYRAKKQRLDLLYKAAALGLTEPEFELCLGKTLVDYGLWNEAKEAYYRGWKIQPNSHLGLLSYLGFLNLCERYTEGLDVFDRITAQAPDFADAVGLKREKFDRYPFGRNRLLRTLRSVRGFFSTISIR